MADDRLLTEAIEAWRTNQRINVLLIKNIGAEGMRCTLSTRGGRNVVRQFTHLQFVRSWQLEKRAKALAEGLVSFESKEEPPKKKLLAALDDSSKRIEEWFRRAHAGEKGFRLMKKGLVSTVGYLISHESHHRGNVLLTLKQSGHGLGNKVQYAVWGEWGRA